jgi:hypothetical protein
MTYNDPEGTYAWVHWREGRRLIFWMGHGTGGPDGSLLYSAPMRRSTSIAYLSSAFIWGNSGG